jgi:hypothetical protein
MGVNLSLIGGAKGCLYHGWTAWNALLDLAKEFGWVPEGTVKDPETQYFLMGGQSADPEKQQEVMRQSKEYALNWDGDYFTNSWQIVTAEDSNNIADALEKALHTIGEDKLIWKCRLRAATLRSLPHKYDSNTENKTGADLFHPETFFTITTFKRHSGFVDSLSEDLRGEKLPKVMDKLYELVPEASEIGFRIEEDENTIESRTRQREMILEFIQFCRMGAFQIC